MSAWRWASRRPTAGRWQNSLGTTRSCGENRECQGRFVCASAADKFTFPGKVPYLLARLLEDGVKAMCIQEFGSIPATNHHRVTKWCLDVDYTSNIRADLDQLQDGGARMSERLRSDIVCLRWAHTEDCICKGPHAQAKRVKNPTSGAKWSWIAVSIHLQQTL